MRNIFYRPFVVGGRGFLGSAFLRELQKRNLPTIGTHHTEIKTFKKLDLQNPKIENVIGNAIYSSAIVTAAATNLLKCHNEPECTYRSNVEGTLQLIDQLCERNILPIVFSTDYVFDGINGRYKEESPLNPLNAYGRQKAELENRLLTNYKNNFLLIRLSKVYGDRMGDSTLIDEMASSLVRKQKIRVAHDQIFNPIYVEDVVRAVVELDLTQARGIYNVCGDESISRLDLARKVCKALGADENLIEPISLENLSEPFIRPKKTDMSNEKLHQKINIQMRSIDHSIQMIVDQYRKESNENK